VRCNARAAFLLCGAAGIIRSPAVEGMAMTIEVESSLGQMTWLIGRSDHPAKAPRNVRARFLVLPVVAALGLLIWALRSGPSDAESRSAPTPSAAAISTRNSSLLNPEITPTQATLATPAEASTPAETAAVEAAPVDGLKISSQSWRRGGLGSNALVTFTVRNGNDFAVKDIEISCAFVRRDGSHLTDRKRLIHETVSMKSRKTFARMHIGFVNVNADKAKCSLLTASRI
jgi:hypothetical protein